MLCFHAAQTGKNMVRTQHLCPQQMLRARANGETLVSATMCPQQYVLVFQYLKIPLAILVFLLFIYFLNAYVCASIM